MAKFTGWKKRYAYLDDYRKGMNGEYVYYGRHYLFSGTMAQLGTYKRVLGILDVFVVALAIVAGCLDAGAIWRMWYVILPYGLEIIAIFLLVWKTVNILLEKHPLKEYIYKKNVPWIRPCGIFLTAAAVLSLIGAVVCMCLVPDEIRTLPCIFYLLIQAVLAVTGIFTAKWTERYTWEPDPSEEMAEE